MTIESSLDGIGSLLREALEIAVSVSSTSRDALENVETVDEIIEQIQVKSTVHDVNLCLFPHPSSLPPSLYSFPSSSIFCSFPPSVLFSICPH